MFRTRTACARRRWWCRPLTRVWAIPEGRRRRRLPSACISRVHDRKWPAQVSRTSEMVEKSSVGAARASLLTMNWPRGTMAVALRCPGLVVVECLGRVEVVLRWVCTLAGI